jgi:OmpA-OmpF porin, OOP family
MKLLRTIPIFALVFLIFPRLEAQKKLVNQSPISKTETLIFADTARFLEKTTELGIVLGQARYNGDLSNDKTVKIEELTPMGGFFVRRHLTPNLALRGNVMAGRLSASDKKSGVYPDRNFSFSTNSTEFSLQAEWNVFGKKRFRRVDTSVYILDRYRQYALVNKFKRTLLPYLFAGGGGTRTKPTPVFDPVVVEKAGFQNQVAEDLRASEKAKTNWGVLFGGGITLDLGRSWLLGAELGARSPFTDYLDGISQAGNPRKNDWYWFGALNLSLRIGKKDRDGDGVPDDKDRCPNTPGRGITKGCPDADGDKIADREDECPHKPGVDIMAGCPLKDVDNDSVPDLFDLCPDVPGLAQFKGCPDTDLDGVEDKLDSCRTVAGLAQFNGCPDTDLDGFEDKVDACPQEKGTDPWYKGCPTRDTDRDSVEDKLDLCPTLAGLVELNGCPDTDKDGITDLEDNCPDKAGKKEFKGCPDTDGDGVADPFDACVAWQDR